MTQETGSEKLAAVTQALKPCPFCGSTAIKGPQLAAGLDPADPSRSLICAGCVAESPPAASDAEAITAWNTRADHTAELLEPTRPEPITPDDAPHWLKGWSPEFYANQHNEHIPQMVREATIAGSTRCDWIGVAIGYLRTIADTSPPQGGLHHSLTIVAEQLFKLRAALSRLSEPTPDAGAAVEREVDHG